MLEFEHGGHKYRANKLSAKRQFHVSRRLAPLLFGLMKSGALSGSAVPVGLDVQVDATVGDAPNALSGDVLEALGSALATMSDTDADYVVDSCLAVVVRQQPGGGWAQLMSGEKLMFEDLDMAGMLTITWQVVQDSLSGFFGTLPQGLPGPNRT
jgi:hypothetical protein